MKKIKYVLALASSLGFGSGFAGTMGAVAPISTHDIKPFITAEGFPVWINFGGIRLTTNGTTKSVDTGYYLSGGARVAGGATYTYSPTIDFSMETAWNYFGSTSGSVRSQEFGAVLSGADVLVGVTYKYKMTEWFLKGGTLFERNLVNYSQPSSFLLESGTNNVYAQINASAVVSDILPMVKVGGLYNYNDALGFTLSYMHAFGQTPRFTGIETTSGSNIYDYIDTNLRGPSLNALMIGLRYQFV